MGERLLCKQKVAGSIPAASTAEVRFREKSSHERNAGRPVRDQSGAPAQARIGSM